VERLRPLAERRGVSVTAEGSSAIVRADPTHLARVLHNLIDNAIKFGPVGGRVSVRAWRTAQEGGLTVEDEGPGIADDLRERVFDRFFRIDPSRDRVTGGSGLGLAIVRELVVAHGGRVEAAPRRPRGSAFTIALPLAQELRLAEQLGRS
jgi:signal transduction histidine kinase